MLQRGRLSALGPEHEANGGYKHAARVFEAMSFGKADDIERRLELLLPFATVLISEIGTLVFVAIALAHRVTGNDPQQRTGRREVPHPTLSRVAARKPLTNQAKAFGATLGVKGAKQRSTRSSCGSGLSISGHRPTQRHVLAPAWELAPCRAAWRALLEALSCRSDHVAVAENFQPLCRWNSTRLFHELR